ncbi:hypothetical protein ACVWY0_001069 [Arthrobacter sp. UYNi723]
MTETSETKDLLRQQLAETLPSATPDQVEELMTMAAATGRTEAGGGPVHHLTWPTSSTYLCGADAVGRRSTERDTDHWNTTCSNCLNHRMHPFAQEAAIEANDP